MVLLFSALWLVQRIHATFFQPIRSMLKTNHDLVVRALESLATLTLRFYWLFRVFPFSWLANGIILVLVLRHSIEKHTYYCNFFTKQFCFNLMYSIVCQHGYDPLYMGFTVNLELLRDMTSVFSQSLVCWVFSSLLKPPHPLAMHFDLISGLFSLVKLSTAERSSK